MIFFCPFLRPLFFFSFYAVKRGVKRGMESRTEFYERIRDFDSRGKIEALKLYYANLPEQGSEEWLKSRRIGASMAAGILGLSKYSTPLDNALQILGLTGFEQKIETKWGNIFEPVAKLWLEQFIEIHEFGSVPGFGKETVYTSCSPDGVFIMTESFAEKHINRAGAMVGRVVLLEIKCPYARFVKKEMPEYYRPQLYLGMRTIDCCEAASFCEFSIRICSILDFNFGNSCRVDMQKSLYGAPMAIGFISVYAPQRDNCPFGKDENIRMNECSYGYGYENPCAPEIIEIPATEGPILDRFHEAWLYLNRVAPTALEFERFEIYYKHFGPDYFWDICKYFRRIVPRWDFVDYGSVNNFNYKWISDLGPELVRLKDFRYGPILFPGQKRLGDWECKEWLVGEMEKLDKKDLLGIIPFKLMGAQVQLVDKVGFDSEIKKLCIFGKNMEIIKNKPQEKWDSLAKTFCGIFESKILVDL
jgi:hypothetical protein